MASHTILPVDPTVVTPIHRHTTPSHIIINETTTTAVNGTTKTLQASLYGSNVDAFQAQQHDSER